MKKLFRQTIFLGCVAAGSLVATLLALDLGIMPLIVNVDKVRVPELSQLPMAKAKKRLDLRRLRLSVRDSLFQETIPAGYIVDQAPAAGHQIKQGRRIFVDVSRGPRLYSVPNVKQISLREARLQLQSAQLQLGAVRYESSSTIPQGAIVEQIPGDGIMLKRNGRVDLFLSSGGPNAQKRVPRVVGLPIEVVEDTLKKYEMRVGRIVEQIDNLKPAGVILEQTPAADTRATRNTRIDLVITE